MRIFGILKTQNKFIDFVLRSCPMLVKFKADGDFDQIGENGVLKFDFSDLKHFRTFEINVGLPEYHKLNVPGK